MDKTFKTHDELITLLISRNINISTPEHKSYAKKALQHEGYYNLVNGYSKLFLASTTPDEKYKSGTTMEEIFALYDFDRKLRNIMFKYILSVETNIKSLTAYYFPQKYGYVPLWVLNNILTLGQISKFYSILKQPDRQQISKTFYILDNQLESILFYLSSVRNFCAHGNRLYCFRTKRPLADFDAHAKLEIPKSDGKKYDYGKRDLFACMLALKYVLPKSEYMKLIKEIYRLFNLTRPKLSVISEQDILREMGFPLDWRAQLLNLLKI